MNKFDLIKGMKNKKMHMVDEWQFEVDLVERINNSLNLVLVGWKSKKNFYSFHSIVK